VCSGSSRAVVTKADKVHFAFASRTRSITKTDRIDVDVMGRHPANLISNMSGRR
jgi:hypothetical protein